MDTTKKGGLSRLVAWFLQSEDTDAASMEVSRFQSQLRHHPLGTDDHGAHAERPHSDPMHRERPHDPMHKEHYHGKSMPMERSHKESVQVEHSDGKHVSVDHAHTDPVHAEHHGHGAISAEHEHAEHGHGHGHGHSHDVMMAKGTGGRLELHGNTLHLTKGGIFGFFVTLLGLHGGHAHQTIRVSDISAIEFEKHGMFFHYVRFCYPGAPKESGNHLHDMMADNALLMSIFDNRGLYRIKERIEHSMEAKAS
jgi:hypothetical protein